MLDLPRRITGRSGLWQFAIRPFPSVYKAIFVAGGHIHFQRLRAAGIDINCFFIVVFSTDIGSQTIVNGQIKPYLFPVPVAVSDYAAVILAFVCTL